jgi:broad specificity phosphatase PhoE
MKRTLWLARHANRLDFVYPEWFELAEKRYDPPLSEDGFIQAQKLAARLQGENIEHIFSSPFLRAIQTAYPVALALQLPLKIEYGLSEWLNPDWMSEHPQTHPRDSLERNYPQIDWSYQSHLLPEYPEAAEQVKRRSAQTAYHLLAQFSGNLLLVGHSKSILGASLGLVGVNPPLQTPLAGLIKLVGQEETWQVELNGDTSYLG